MESIEYIDIVNDGDEVIGLASKEDIYKKRLLHRIVHIMILNDKNEIALQLRSKNTSYCPLHWSTSVGGHVQSGESCEDAALREYDEELGTTSKITFFNKDYYEGETANKFLYIFKSDFNGPFSPNPSAVGAVSFFSIDKIKNMIESGEKFHPELLFILKKYFF
ncbi:MAG: NUDIX domain-containing protein [Nanoarchaeota archaeon]|nr:NUDIX domain-containing protein [Nanoarchaeota archaeon]